jgi:hypothetical protein
VPDDIASIIKDAIDSVLQNQQYNEQKVGIDSQQQAQTSSSNQQQLMSDGSLQVTMWTSGCLENCMKRLTGLNKPFKYVVTCIIMQKTGEHPVPPRQAPAAAHSPAMPCHYQHENAYMFWTGTCFQAYRLVSGTPGFAAVSIVSFFSTPLCSSSEANSSSASCLQPITLQTSPCCLFSTLLLLLQVLGCTQPPAASGTLPQTAAAPCAGRTSPCTASPACLAWPCDAVHCSGNSSSSSGAHELAL